MPKHSKKHVRRFHLGKPVKPKRTRRSVLGRPREHPVEDSKISMLRSTEGERLLWDSAARYESQMLDLPSGAELSWNAWARRTLNAAAARIAAHANGITVKDATVE